MVKMQTYIQSEIQVASQNFELSGYAWLRSLLVARLTLFNARRGEEGSRLLLEEWEDARQNKWVPNNTVKDVKDDVEQYLVGKFRLAYMAGKGGKLVPVLIPIDCVRGIELLVEKRDDFGISKENPFVFATKSSIGHCSGWHAVSTVCEAAGVPQINATKNRHRASTAYACLDMCEKDRRIFFSHLGHSEAINRDNYQCPPGLNEIEVMGRFLTSLEGNLVYK